MAKQDMNNKEQCSIRVASAGTWGAFHPHQCRKVAVVTREGKLYCKIHDPEYIEAKREAREAEWDKEWTEKRARWHRDELIEGLFENISTAQIEGNLEAYKVAIKEV